MDEGLWSVKTCSSQISALPLWIIEYAWRNRMSDVLEVLGPPLWLEGDCGHLSLEEPCSIRVMAAEAWMIIRARDIRHFERVIEFLEVIHGLRPQLVSSIKHMKIMFGLKSLVIMWMLWEDQCVRSITDKITRFFPDNLPQYYRSTRKHLELMQKTQQDFRSFAQTLIKNPDMRKAYIRDLMEEQYGERYARKVEERLSYYLKELDKALPQPTHIDQILNQSFPLEKTEKLLHQLLTCNSASLPTVMKRLLRCAMATHSNQVDADKLRKRAESDGPVLDPFCIALRPSQESQEERLSQRTWLNRDKSPSLLQNDTDKIHLERSPVHLKPKSGLRLEITPGEMDPCVAKQQDQREGSALNGGQKINSDVTEVQMCSKHGKKMKSILLECSEELKAQNSEAPLAQSECTPPSPLAPLLQSSPQILTHSPASNPLQDSSSTYVSLSSHPDSSCSFFNNHSEAEVRDASSQSLSGQPVNSSPTSQDIITTSSDQQKNISTLSSLSAKHILPMLFSSLQKITTTSQSLETPSLSQMECLSLPSASFLVLPECSSPLANSSSFLGNQSILQSCDTSLDMSPSPKTSSSAQQDSFLSMFSKNQICSTGFTSPATSHTPSSSDQKKSSSPLASSSAFLRNQGNLKSTATSLDISPSPTASSTAQQESSSTFFKNQISSPASTSPAASPTVSSSVQQERQDVISAMSVSDSVLRDKLKLSLEAQGIFLQCKWLQPQVLLCRLSQQDNAVTTRGQRLCEEEEEEENVSIETQRIFLQCKRLQPKVLLCRLSQHNNAMNILPKGTRGQIFEEEETEEEEEENVSFDVNLLYSDSESDPLDSDDPDYAPPKRRRSFVDF